MDEQWPGPGEDSIKQFAKDIKDTRLAAGLTVRELAKRAHMSRTPLNNAELGRQIPSDAVVAAYIMGVGGEETAVLRWQQRAGRLRDSFLDLPDRRPPATNGTAVDELFRTACGPRLDIALEAVQALQKILGDDTDSRRVEAAKAALEAAAPHVSDEVIEFGTILAGAPAPIATLTVIGPPLALSFTLSTSPAALAATGDGQTVRLILDTTTPAPVDGRLDIISPAGTAHVKITAEIEEPLAVDQPPEHRAPSPVRSANVASATVDNDHHTAEAESATAPQRGGRGNHGQAHGLAEVDGPGATPRPSPDDSLSPRLIDFGVAMEAGNISEWMEPAQRSRPDPTVRARPGNSSRRRGRVKTVAILASIVIITIAAVVVWITNAGPSVCSTMITPVQRFVNPVSGVSILTTSETDAESAFQRSYSQDLGILFKAATSPAPGLTPIHSLYNPTTTNSAYIKEGLESQNAVRKYGYRDDGVAFYASATPTDCAIPVYRYRLDIVHRFVVSSIECAGLSSSGWVSEGVSFYAVKPESTESTTTSASTAVTSVEVASC